MALKSNLGISEFIGNFHEQHAENNPPGEENMDKWNNAKGREIAKEIRKQYNPIQIITLIHNGQMDDIIAKKNYL